MYLVFTQVYPPDPAAVGQHIEDAAVRLAERSKQVTIYTADRDYDNPSIRYDNRSRHSGVTVVRLRWSSFGKKTIAHRLLGQVIYLTQCFFIGLFSRKVEGVVMTTIPATTGLMFLLLGAVRRFRLIYWVMDLNPDQAVALGVFQANSLPVRLLGWANRRLYAWAERIVVMDAYMRDRLLAKEDLPSDTADRVTVIPPWPMESHIRPIARENNSFLKEQGLAEKAVIFMYSGNHSLVHPLKTFLQAISSHCGNDALAFLFVGGGRGKADVEKFIENHPDSNVRSLPYQPLEQLSASLSAADVHIVVMGDAMVGIVHPCKIYGAMTVGKPVLYIGPRESHLGKLISEGRFGWVIEHGESDKLEGLIAEIIETPREELDAMGARGRAIIKESYSADVLAEKFCDIVVGAY